MKLANWLRERDVYFCIRLKKNEFVEVENEIWLELNDLGLKPGVSVFLKGVKLTKQKGFASFYVACQWKRRVLGVAAKEGWFICTNLPTLKLAIAAYKKRFCIEEISRNFKKGGLMLEDTNVSGERLIWLIVLIAIAHTGATIHRRQIKHQGIQKYVVRVKESGRSHLRHSSFYVGLYGQTWVHFIDNCWELVLDLMRLSPNKRQYYQRGNRAMKLILSVS